MTHTSSRINLIKSRKESEVAFNLSLMIFLSDTINYFESADEVTPEVLAPAEIG